MDNFETFIQLKERTMSIFEYKEEIPVEVHKTIQEMFNSLEKKYKEMECYTPNIQEYMHGNLEELMARLNSEIGNRRKDEQYDDIQVFLRAIERKLEEKLDSEEQKRRDNEDKENIGEIANDAPNNIRITLNTMDLIEEYLRDVQSRQNRILYARGLYSQSQIEDINDEIRYFIMHLRNRNEEKIHEAYQSDNAQLREEILQAFEEYTIQRGEEPNKKESFKDSLFAGISLEEQNVNAKRFVADSQEANQEQEKSGKTGLAVDTLPELFL